MASRSPSRKPDFEIVALIKGTKISQRLGAVWINEGGHMHVTFQPFVDLNAVRDMGTDVQITMFDRRRDDTPK